MKINAAAADPFYEQVESLTLDFVKTPSVNGTTSESDMAEKILSRLRVLPYFAGHPGDVWTQALPDDTLGRKNVFALVRGGKCRDGRTVILHGHMDTVDVGDFGKLAPFAFSPERLMEKMASLPLSDDVRADLESGDWLFGRGANDMKSGVAAHIAVMDRLSRHAELLCGNILFMANPVEENEHTGAVTAISELERLRDKEKLTYVAAFNNDFTSPLFEGDSNNYAYLGASGKLLPCFYIVGRETHVGQCFEGFDPNLAAANLVKKLDLNTELSDGFDGEYTMPPTVLRCRDLKPAYNVQTPLDAFLYVNYYVNTRSVREVTKQLTACAAEAFSETVAYVDAQKKAYCKKAGLAFSPCGFEPRVITFSELYEKARVKSKENLDEEVSKLAANLSAQGRDKREICLQVVKKLYAVCDDKKPSIVFFYAPPYCPHNTLNPADKKEAELEKIIKAAADKINSQMPGTNIVVKRFYPSLSDSSYLKSDDDGQSTAHLADNCPCFREICNVPVERIKKLDIPAVTLGCYGKDAHKMTERVYKPYTFETLPRFELTVLNSILQQSGK